MRIGNWKYLGAASLLVCAFLCAPAQATNFENIIDATTGVRLSIPVDIVGKEPTHQPWGSNWGFRASNLSIDTLNFGSTKTLTEFFNYVRTKPGRTVSSQELKDNSFQVRGTDDRGTTQFFISARVTNGELRGLSVAYDTTARTRLSPIVDQVVASFDPFPAKVATAAAQPATEKPAPAPPKPAPTKQAQPSSSPAQPANSPVIASSDRICPSIEQQGMRIALVVGNSAYPGANSLPNPRNDAIAIAKALRDLNFTVIEGTDLDKRKMEGKIREFNRMLGQSDNQPLALVYYAGHGIQVDGRNYLIPIDAKLERTTDIELDVIDVELVLRQMASQTTCANIVLLDACRNNPFAERFYTTLNRTRGISTTRSQGLAPIAGKIRETYIVFAAEPNALADDGSGQNSPFAEALLKNIYSAGLDFQLMMRNVRNDVTKFTNQRQRPTEYGDITKSIVMLPKPAPSADAVGGPR